MDNPGRSNGFLNSNAIEIILFSIAAGILSFCIYNYATTDKTEPPIRAKFKASDEAKESILDSVSSLPENISEADKAELIRTLAKEYLDEDDR